MSNIEKTLLVQSKDGVVREFFIYIDEHGSSDIILRLDVENEKIFSGSDLFESLCLLRMFFEYGESKVLCNGSRIDVYPSGMSRGMGRGDKAYMIKIGKQAFRTDLVDIFEYASPESVGTVEEQKRYQRDWMESLGFKPCD